MKNIKLNDKIFEYEKSQKELNKEISRSLDDLENFGFSKIPFSLNKNTLTIINNFLEEESISLQDENDNKFHGKNVGITTSLHTKCLECLEISLSKELCFFADQFFEEGSYPGDINRYQVELMHSRTIFGKAKEQTLHIDSRLCGVRPYLMIHFFIYLTDCIEVGSGATQFVPKSHTFNRYSNKEDEKDAVQVYGKAGTIIALNSSTFHGSSKKTNNGNRSIITLAYSRWWIRQQWAVPYVEHWPKKLSEEEKYLLGFYNYADSTPEKRGSLTSRGNLPLLILKD